MSNNIENVIITLKVFYNNEKTLFETSTSDVAKSIHSRRAQMILEAINIVATLYPFSNDCLNDSNNHETDN